MFRFENLTPHVVNIFDENGEKVSVQPSGLARVSSNQTVRLVANGIKIVTESYGEVQGLPDAKFGTFYIVSAMVRLACPDRKDLLSPGSLVRDSEGNIIGCGALISN
jgi:hypothetical protein